MREIENNPLEELRIRADNLQMILEATEMELWCVLRDIEKLTEKRQIGFKLSKDRDVKKTSN